MGGPQASSTTALRRDVLDVELMPATRENDALLYGGAYQTDERVVDDAPPPTRWRVRPWQYALLIPSLFVVFGVWYSIGMSTEKSAATDDDRRSRARSATTSDSTETAAPETSAPQAAAERTPLSALTLGLTPAPSAATVEDGIAACSDRGADVAWEFTAGGYRESCRGAAGNLGSFANLTLARALADCCAADACAGLSFDNVTGNGVFKRNLGCGITASPVYEGWAKASRIPTTSDSSTSQEEEEEDSCGGWEHVAGGYREACGGAAGNLDGFQGLALAEAERACCETAGCAGFSFDNVTGNGVWKSNARCGITTSDVYDGYSIRRPTTATARQAPARGWGSWVFRSGP